MLVHVGPHANPPAVYTYSSALETGSPRFSLPGDFFTYVFFVGAVIMVSCGLICPISTDRAWRSLMSYFRHHPNFFLSPLYFFSSPITSHICPPSLILAEAVPGREEDHPCISYSTSFALILSAVCVAGRWESH